MDQESMKRQECEPDRVTLAIEADPTTGYAAIQNNVPIVRSISLTNASEVELRDVELIVSCLPTFARGFRLRFERLAPAESRRIAPLDLQPDHGYLSRLDEGELASIAARVTSEGNPAGAEQQQINVLAYDQWAGTRCLPELLAAFCMPNSRVVDQLIGKASALLRTGAPGLSMSGYQSKNREHVWKQVSAIYSTLCGEEIHYSNPPASFGTDGQKIRTPERILDGRVATCLDLAMLFASCIEQAGLHPVVLFKEGHAWAGCWLVETCFPTAVVDDVQAVRKRVQSGEFMVFEMTGICEQTKPSLRWACSAGEEHLNEEAKFHYAVDISRARQLQIRALPSRSAIATELPQVEAVGVTPTIEDMPALPPLDPALLPVTQASGDETPEGRLAKWKSKLLDLTLRNRLLNFKPTKSSLRVHAPDLARLEDALAEGKEFRIRPLPQVMEGADPRDAAVFVARSGKSALEAFAEDALARREVIADVPETALDSRLVEIFRAASLGLEEGGANTLFLVFGLLEWREEKEAEASHLAPILLVPVTLTRQSVRSGFRLARHDDDAIVNPTLIQKLWQDFSLRLPSFEVLPTDEKGIDIGAILQTFRIHVADIKGWEVKEQVHLGIFSFTKYLMWKDLQDRTEQLQQNRVVAHLINNPGKAFADCELAFAPATLDETHRPQDLLPTLLQKLKPCLLMSPLSVAQYLEAGHAQFDLVVFDEASQIPVWDSVGAIARGRMLVCVGDPKQLPPTNFFNRADDPDAPGATEDNVHDLESILDECLGSGLPKLSLEWHYRSKHESLIAFSNATYYEGRLITFPSPVTEDMAVRFEHVHGVYDRGGSRTNRAEADTIVAAIERHYLDPECCQQSLGVVTFNQAQQNLIENLLDARRRASTKLDQAIAQVSFEPLFIKNLENVQGDERDIIFFSVTYGPDASGRVTLNFGPLNLEGGHRRLNVAISRARQGVVIFSTLLPEHIDLSRVSAAGVRDLKNYLEFAIRGPRALVEQSIPTGRETESPFEQAVVHALRDKGWVVHPQVGVSGYRIDIGVVAPRAPGRYLLGIECDGRSYHSGATARDRDRLRQHVLEGLGWRLHRIWSTDWWLNAPEQLARLQARLEEMLSSDVEERAPVAQDGASEEVGDDAGVPEALATPAYARMMVDDSAARSAPVGLPEYRVATVRGGLPNAFYLDTSSAELERQLLEVIQAEGPIADALLYERIARAWGLKRTGKRIGERLMGLVPSQVRKTRDDGRLVYWPRMIDPDSWDGFRVTGEASGSRRDIESVCPEELANIAIYVLTHSGATTREDLARQVCRLLGVLRTSAETERRVVKALSCGRAKALVTADGGMISPLRV